MAVKKKAKANKMPAKKETSDAMSTLAAKVLANKGVATKSQVKKLAASVLSQDETKGIRKKKK